VDGGIRHPNTKEHSVKESIVAPNRQAALFEEAQTVLASGVSASLRLHPYLGRPFYLTRGDGPYVFDLDGNRYIDFNMSNGAAMLGHNHPTVGAAVREGLEAGIIAAAETPYHERLASVLTQIIPSAERVRFASTGSEVTLVALRLARHVTGRVKFLKFEGHFHGLTEPFLFRQADPANADGRSIPSSDGVPESHGADVIIVPWNDAEAFDAVMTRHGSELAAVIVEPVFFNAGCIPPESGFLALLRSRTRETGSILIFDEVLSGFRMALGGVQELSGITPDLSTFAKALANGMPLSALVGSTDLMSQLAPTGPVVHSGTYSGHLLSVLAALATLTELRKPGIYDHLRATSESFYQGMQAIFDRHGLPIRVQGLGTRFGLYFGRTQRVRTLNDARGHDHDLHQRFVLGCLDRGVYFHAFSGRGVPGHAGFSLSHDDEVLATALEVFDAVAANLRGATT
jgi:glutamate-1-semialdehyde 2,1-aminomutase